MTARRRGSRLPGEDARAGFTLVELIVVLTLAALMLGAVMSFGTAPRRHAALAAGARELAAALRATRAQAVASGLPADLTVDVALGHWWSSGHPARAFPADVRAALSVSDVAGPSQGAIRFFPDGSSTGGGVAVEAADTRFEILVDWVTGGVRVHEHRLLAPAAARH
jgi:general secretion pathway protein H